MEREYHILVVEDDKEIREGVEIYLKNQGYLVFQAANGQEGLDVLKKEEIHLAIVDILPLTLEEIFIYEMGGLGYEVKDILF